MRGQVQLFHRQRPEEVAHRCAQLRGRRTQECLSRNRFDLSWRPRSSVCHSEAAQRPRNPGSGISRATEGARNDKKEANRGLEYDFILAPGADPNAIRLRFEGAKIGVVGASFGSAQDRLRDAPAYHGRAAHPSTGSGQALPPLPSRPYNSDGDLIVKVGDQKLIEHAPVIYQEIGGKRRTIAGGWRLHGAHEAGFRWRVTIGAGRS